MSAYPQWLNWAHRLESVAQTGLFYEPPAFDRERYEAVMAIAAEMITAAAEGQADVPGDLRDLLLELMHGQAGHTTPKIDVRGVVFQGDKLLLVQETLDQNRWTLPGGWADPGESASESTVREVWEETGFRVSAVKLLAVFDRARHHPPFIFDAYKIYFRCELSSDVRAVNPHNVETGDVGWFGADEIPPDLSLGRVTAAQIARFFRHLHDPSLPTEFD